MPERGHRREQNKESKDKDKESEAGKSQSEDRDHSDVCKRKPKKKVRKLWGTRRAQHVGSVKNRIANFIDRVEDLSVYRNFKRHEGKEIWWFEIFGNELVLSELESKWKHDNWKLEKVSSTQHTGSFLEKPTQGTQNLT